MAAAGGEVAVVRAQLLADSRPFVAGMSAATAASATAAAKMARHFQKVAGMFGAAARAIQGLGRQIEIATNGIKNFGKKLTMMLTVPFEAFKVASIRAFAEFDNTLNKIIGLVGIATDKVRAMGDQLLRMSGTGKNAQELAEGLFFVTSAGIEGAQAMSVLNQSARAASAGLGETAVVADAVTSALNAFGSESLSATQAVDVLVATVREGKAMAEDIAPALGRVIPIAAQLGLGFDEVGASIAAMTRVGFSADEAVTSLRGALVKFLRPTERASELLAETGQSAESLKASLADKGLLGTLQHLNRAFGGSEQKMGMFFEDIQALAGVLALTGENAAQVEEIFRELGSASGAAANAFAAVEESPYFKIQEALANVKNTLIEFGEVLAPSFVRFLDTVSNLLKFLMDLPKPIKEFIGGLGRLLSKLGPSTIALGMFTKFVVQLITVNFMAARATQVMDLALSAFDKNVGGARVGVASLLRGIDGMAMSMSKSAEPAIRDMGLALQKVPAASAAEKMANLDLKMTKTSVTAQRTRGAMQVLFSGLVGGRSSAVVTSVTNFSKLTYGMNRAGVAATFFKKSWEGATSYIHGMAMTGARSMGNMAVATTRFLNPVTLMPKVFERAKSAARSLFGFLTSGGGGLVVAIAAVYGLVTWAKKVEERFDSAAESAQKLSESLGIVYQEAQKLSDEDFKITLEFSQSNAALIRALRDATMIEREQLLMEVGLSMQLGGVSNEEIQQALERIVQAAGVTMLPVEFDINPADAAAQLESALESVADMARMDGIVNSFIQLDSSVARLFKGEERERIKGVALQVANLANAATSAQPAIRAIEEFDAALTAAGVHGDVAASAMNVFIDEILNGLGGAQAGLSIRNAHDLATATEELSNRFDDAKPKHWLNQIIDIRIETQNLAREQKIAADIADSDFVPTNLPASQARLEDLREEYGEFEEAVDEAVMAVRELLDAQEESVSPFLRLIRSNQRAEQSLADYTEAVDDAQKAAATHGRGSEEHAEAMRKVEDAALGVTEAQLSAESAVRSLATTPRELEQNLGSFNQFMSGLVENFPDMAEAFGQQIIEAGQGSDELLEILREIDEADNGVSFTMFDDLDEKAEELEEIENRIIRISEAAAANNFREFLRIDRQSVNDFEAREIAAAAAESYAEAFQQRGNEALASAGIAGAQIYTQQLIDSAHQLDRDDVIPPTFEDNVASHMGAIGRVAGNEFVNDLADSLEQRSGEINAIAQRYSTELQRGLGPLLSSLGISVNQRSGTISAQMDGSVLTAYANGGMNEKHVAQIAPAGAMRLWAEPETGGEAYIPLAIGKRNRSTQILHNVAERFGYQMHEFAEGGMYTRPEDVARPPGLPGGPPLTLPAENMMDRAYKGARKMVTAPPLHPGIGYQAMMQALWTQFPGLQLISGFRPGAITATGNPSYHGKGRAVDIPPRFDVNSWIYRNYKHMTKELIFSPPGAYQVRNGADYVYSGITKAMHYDHNHWALANGGIVTRATSAIIGESGAEAVMPLTTFGDALSAMRGVSDTLLTLTQEIATHNEHLIAAEAMLANANTEAEREAAQAIIDAINNGIESREQQIADITGGISTITSAIGALSNLERAAQNLEDAHNNVADVSQQLEDNMSRQLDLGLRRLVLEEDLIAARERALQVTAREELAIMNARQRVNDAREERNNIRDGVRDPRDRLQMFNTRDELLRLRKMVAENIGSDGAPIRQFDDEAIENARRQADAAKRVLDDSNSRLDMAEAAHNDALAMVARAEANIAGAAFESARLQQVADIIRPGDEVRALLLQYKGLKLQADAQEELADAEMAAADTADDLLQAQQGVADAVKNSTEAYRMLREAEAGTILTANERQRLLVELEIAEDNHRRSMDALIPSAADLRRAELELLIAEEELREAKELSVAPTQEVIDLEQELAQVIDDLNSTQQEHRDLTRELEQAYTDVAVAQLGVVDAQMALIDAIMALDGVTEPALAVFEELAVGIGGFTDDVVEAIELLNELSGASIPAPPSAPPAPSLPPGTPGTGSIGRPGNPPPSGGGRHRGGSGRGSGTGRSGGGWGGGWNYYDAGGILPPGLTMAMNMTGRNEFVLTGDQLTRVANMGRSGDGGGGTYTITIEQTFNGDMEKKDIESANKELVRSLIDKLRVSR